MGCLMFAGCLAPLGAAPPPAEGAPRIYNILEFGAKGDGATLATNEIQKALDACSASGGGEVVVPPGVFLTAGLVIKDNTTLRLDHGATLLASKNREDYKGRQNLIYAKNAKNIAVVGPGIIDGQASGNWKKLPSFPEEKEHRRTFGWVPHHYFKNQERAVGGLILMEGSSSIVIDGVTLKNSGGWTLHLLGCDGARIENVKIRNPLDGPTLDGIDLQASQNVVVNNCDIFTSDDAICLKNRHPKYPQAVRNVTITNCILTTICNGFKIGTETHGDFENINVRNLIIQGASPEDPLAVEAAKTIDPNHYGDALAPLSGIAIESVDGANIRGVTVENVLMKDVRAPIFVRLAQRGIIPEDMHAGAEGTAPVKAPPGSIEGVVIRNVTAFDASCASSVTGIPGHPVGDVTLSNVFVRTIPAAPELASVPLPEKADAYPEATMWGALPCYALFARHVKDLTIENTTFEAASSDTRPAILHDDVADFQKESVKVNPAK